MPNPVSARPDSCRVEKVLEGLMFLMDEAAPVWTCDDSLAMAIAR